MNMRLVGLILAVLLLCSARSVRLSAWMAAVDAKHSITATAKRLLPVCDGAKCYPPRTYGEPVRSKHKHD